MKDNPARKQQHIEPFKSSNSPKCRPFLKWVGGKSQLLPDLMRRIPSDAKRYFEPFIGGGALLFACRPKKAYISDINPELINAYQVVKNDVEALIKNLSKHTYEKTYYYEIRNADRFPSFKRWSQVRRASRLIFLNKTCFNGLYRVNSKGHFNTPFGRYSDPAILDAENLRACSRVLQSVSIQLAGFDFFEDSADKGDFVYFDPPYAPLSATSYFTSYSSAGFDAKMQCALFELCCRLDKRGVRFMLSNSSAPFVKALYKRFKIERVPAIRAINSKAEKRGAVQEVIVTNY